jgi:hypothetical protein
MVAAVVLLLLTGMTAWAKDRVQEGVTPVDPATALVTPNGLAVGTIHVVYTVEDYTFTAGAFATFAVDLGILPVDGNPVTSYGLKLKLLQKQQGAGSLILTPAAGQFDVPGNTWAGSTTVSVAIPEGAPSEDGTVLEGSLQLEAEGSLDSKGRPTNPQLDTNTSIVVKVVLMHPTACLKVANFVTDNDFNAVDTAIVNLKTDKKTGVTTLNSTNPGQFSDNILVANICGEDQLIDLSISLDSCFDTNPAGNPGQAVFTYLANGEIDAASFDIGVFGAGTGHGQDLCLSGLVVPARQTLLGTVHMAAIKGTLESLLPAGGFAFAASLSEGGNACGGQALSLADPAAATTVLPYATTK